MLPVGWQAAAKAEKAFVRRGRYIKTAEDLLKVVLLYLTEGESFGQTAAMLQITGEYPVTKTAVYERVTESAEWLKWMCEHLLREHGLLAEEPEWLKEYRVCLVDATHGTKPGSDSSDFRLHYLIELFQLRMVEMELTSTGEGETITRYQKLRERDIVIGDRAYGTIKGMDYVSKKKADYMFRLRTNAFCLYTEDHKVFDLTGCLENWEPGKVLDLHLYYKSGKAYRPVRVCAVGKTKEGIAKSTKQLERVHSKKTRGPLSADQTIWNRFIVVVTSLPDSISPEQILQLYRMRWQIELVFKRLKSIFDLGDLTCFKEQAVSAWFYGKLLLSGLCEVLVSRGHFSPAQK